MRHRSLIFPELSSAPRASSILNSKFHIHNYLGEGYFHSGTPEPLSYTPIRWMRKSKVL